MRVFRTLGAALILTTLASGASAADRCSSVLSGVYDYRLDIERRSNFSSFKSWFCSDTDSNSSAQLGFKSLRYDVNGATQNSLSERLCSSNELAESSFRKIVSIVKSANPKVVEAWSECMGRPGFKIGIQQSSNPETFSVVMKFVYTGVGPNFARLSSGSHGFSVTPKSSVICTSNWLKKKNRKIVQQQTITCTRSDTSKGVRVTVNARPSPLESGGILDVPAWREIEIIANPRPLASQCRITAVTTASSSCSGGRKYVGAHPPPWSIKSRWTLCEVQRM